MSDLYGKRVDGRVEWSIPLPNMADQFYKLVGRMELEAQDHGVETHYGDWFEGRIDDLDPNDSYESVLISHGRKHKLTLWFDLPEGAECIHRHGAEPAQ